MMKNKSHFRDRTRGYTRRRIDLFPVRQRFLIICEGKRTEPNYFLKYRAPGLVIRVEGKGCDPIGLVRKAKKLRDVEKKKLNDFDQVWCVFDRDENLPDQFNAALALADNYHFKVAYSNQCFELWYLLHFQFQNTSLSRPDYITRLDRLLGHPYEKDSETIYSELYERRPDAIKNAARLLDKYEPLLPEKNDPSTTVHHLVEQLIKYSQPFGTK
jgi:hypothetical protein